MLWMFEFVNNWCLSSLSELKVTSRNFIETSKSKKPEQYNNSNCKFLTNTIYYHKLMQKLEEYSKYNSTFLWTDLNLALKALHVFHLQM